MKKQNRKIEEKWLHPRRSKTLTIEAVVDVCLNLSETLKIKKMKKNTKAGKTLAINMTNICRILQTQ